MYDFGQGWRRFVSFTMMAVFLFGLALLASQHLQHIVGMLPYVLLLACPLMHLFGHGHHHHSHDNHSPNDTHQKSSA
jgi:hypothetical protein